MPRSLIGDDQADDEEFIMTLVDVLSWPPSDGECPVWDESAGKWDWASPGGSADFTKLVTSKNDGNVVVSLNSGDVVWI